MKIFKVCLIIFLLNCFYTSSHAQPKTIEFTQLDSVLQNEYKPTLIFIHTDWCKYCAAMKQSTLKHKEVIDLLNENYYFIEFNAEEKKDILFNSSIYKYIPNGIKTGVHELANELASINEEISYPTIIILNLNREIVYKTSGFVSSKSMLYLLQQFK